LGLGIVSVGCVGTLKWLSRKEAKHGKIESLALCRINDVKALTSQALTDGRISAEEFRHVLHEEESYRQAVDGIRAEDRSASHKAPVDIEALKTRCWRRGARMPCAKSPHTKRSMSVRVGAPAGWKYAVTGDKVVLWSRNLSSHRI
jgi:hypothetical protein